MANKKSLYIVLLAFACLFVWIQIRLYLRDKQLLQSPHCYTSAKIIGYKSGRYGYIYLNYTFSYKDSTIPGEEGRRDKNTAWAREYVGQYADVVFSLEDYGNNRLLLDGFENEQFRREARDTIVNLR